MADPAVIETIVIKDEELLTAVEANKRGSPTTLRVTAPFNPRMRARLHVRQPGDGDDTRQVLVPPERLIDEQCPPLPRPDDTADTVLSEATEFSVEEQHDRHVAAVESWRATVPAHVVDRVELPALDDPVTITMLSADDEDDS